MAFNSLYDIPAWQARLGVICYSLFVICYWLKEWYLFYPPPQLKFI
ncbi:hypothetical protein D1AOALGA4SA_8777 [Olavius algarvensis Delta 1 endosymbiont]|nr:hypothetical protein D1AOALGA4SA_8777 [Olavius algarvensis Delta 1 endosymbiont]